MNIVTESAHLSRSWPHSWTVDPRTPIWISTSTSDPPLAFYMFSIVFWVELFMFIGIGIVISSVFGFLLFQFCLKKPAAMDPSGRYFVGYGIFCLGWILLPKPVTDSLGVKNKLFRFCFCILSPITAFFRTSAALNGFIPRHAEHSVSAFIMYFASPLTLAYDAKTQTAVLTSRRDSFRHFMNFVGLLFVSGTYQSLFFIFDFFPNLGRYNTQTDWYHMKHIVNVSWWKDTFLYAFLFQLYLTTFCEGLTFATEVVTGIKVLPVMNNPLFESSSPSDFWGRRWNLLIHTCLKDGIYKPVRKLGASPAASTTAAFFASGILHEWILPVVFFDYPNLRPGFSMAFFSWNALLVIMEVALRNQKWLIRVSQSLPKQMRTLLVLLMALPLGHWFCDVYVRSDFFLQGGTVFPLLVPLSATMSR